MSKADKKKFFELLDKAFKKGSKLTKEELKTKLPEGILEEYLESQSEEAKEINKLTLRLMEARQSEAHKQISINYLKALSSHYKSRSKPFNRKETPVNQKSIKWKEFLDWADLNQDLIKQKSKSPKRGWRAELYESASKTLDLSKPTFYRHLKKYLAENLK